MSNKQKSRRRTSAVSGFVNFPVNDPDLPSDGQGGMFVRLVVYDAKADKNYYDKWGCCCGGTQSFIYDECYIGDDHSDENCNDQTEEDFHFPWLHLVEEHPAKHRSREYLCIMTIGSTGWSNTEWTCTYDSLTEKGKSLYKLIQELYPGCKIFLQTWLDT